VAHLERLSQSTPRCILDAIKHCSSRNRALVFVVTKLRLRHFQVPVSPSQTFPSDDLSENALPTRSIAWWFAPVQRSSRTANADLTYRKARAFSVRLTVMGAHLLQRALRTLGLSKLPDKCESCRYPNGFQYAHISLLSSMCNHNAG
jgi:hypothetical protein